MKINQPITNREKTFSTKANLLSTTDLKGIISYVNDDFCEVAEFTSDELLRKNHNVVRHPDMPPAAFDNLWRYLKAGKPWMGMVKNRCKGGDHYWVDAYVMPIKRNGEVAEYQSVRLVPDREQLKRAEAEYQLLNDGKQPSLLARMKIPFAAKVFGSAVAGFAPLIGVSVAQMTGAGLSGLVVGGATVLSLGLAYAGVNMATRKVTELADQTRTLFDNDLMRRIYGGGNDEVAQIALGLKMVRTELRSVLGRIRDVSEQNQSAAGRSQHIMQETSEITHRQQGEIHQLVTAIEQMSASIQEVAQNCEQSSSESERAKSLANDGREASGKAMQSNDMLIKEIDTSTAAIDELAKQSRDIGSVLDVIKSIAEQTNLLALNAAIEAARAGEQGRGFAVVADEVRTLAQRTHSSTEEIENMIVKLQKGADHAVKAMENSKQRSEDGVADIRKTDELLTAIAQSVQNITDMSVQIATATEQQSSVAEEINQKSVAVNDMTDATTSNVADAVDIADALANRAKSQLELVEQFSSAH